MMVIQYAVTKQSIAYEFLQISGGILLLLVGAIFKKLNWEKGYKALLPLWILIEGLIINTERFIITVEQYDTPTYYSELRFNFTTKFVLSILFGVIDFKYLVFFHIPIFICSIVLLLAFEIKYDLSVTDKHNFVYFNGF